MPRPQPGRTPKPDSEYKFLYVDKPKIIYKKKRTPNDEYQSLKRSIILTFLIITLICILIVVFKAYSKNF